MQDGVYLLLINALTAHKLVIHRLAGRAYLCEKQTETFFPCIIYIILYNMKSVSESVREGSPEQVKEACQLFGREDVEKVPECQEECQWICQ